MIISRFLARSWITNLDATRECNRTGVEAGQSIAFVITVRNNGGLPVAWVLVEDMLPRGAITSRTNVLFSIPMLFFMGAASHYQLFAEARGAGIAAWIIIAGAIIVLLDQFTRLDGTGSTSSETNNSNIISQLPWIQNVRPQRPFATHAFVPSHRNLIGQNHVDCLLGSDPSQNPDARNAFIGSLAASGVRYYLNGHDHTHHRSQVLSPDGKSSIDQQIGASDSSKFYIPAIPSHDQLYDNPTRETPIT
jgi:uncharacterized repeat protein (TIGR01451 family)